MKVRAGGVSRRAHITDVLTSDDVFSDGGVDAVLPHMRVGGRDGLAIDAVLNHDESAIAARELRDGHDTIRCCEYGCPIGGSKDGARVEGLQIGRASGRERVGQYV